MSRPISNLAVGYACCLLLAQYPVVLNCHVKTSVHQNVNPFPYNGTCASLLCGCMGLNPKVTKQLLGSTLHSMTL